MSNQNKLNNAKKRARSRDKKRQTKMGVSGRAIFTTERLQQQPRKK